MQHLIKVYNVCNSFSNFQTASCKNCLCSNCWTSMVRSWGVRILRVNMVPVRKNYTWILLSGAVFIKPYNLWCQAISYGTRKALSRVNGCAEGRLVRVFVCPFMPDRSIFSVRWFQWVFTIQFWCKNKLKYLKLSLTWSHELFYYTGASLNVKGSSEDLLTRCMLGRNFNRQHFEVFFLFFLENRICHFMQIVSTGDNLHEVADPIF